MRRNHAPGFKAKVALAAIKVDKTFAELTEQLDVHPTQISEWKQQFQESVADIFGSDQCCQFTSLDFTSLLNDNDIEIGMDGKGC